MPRVPSSSSQTAATRPLRLGSRERPRPRAAPRRRTGRAAPCGRSCRSASAAAPQLDEALRHHVVGQRARAGARAGPPPPTLLARRRHVVRHQRRLARGRLAHHHARLAHARVVGQPRLDLAQLDAEAAHLHLGVGAAEALDLPVGANAAEVAGAVQPRAGRPAERVGDEPLRRQLGPVEVAARDAVAADVELARHADRARLAAPRRARRPRCSRSAGRSRRPAAAG